MARKVLSEAATVRMAVEAALSTAPSSGWIQLQPDQIEDWDAMLDTVERDPISVYASDEKGDVVGLRAEPKLTHDLNFDLLLLKAGAMFRTAAKNPGGTSQSVYRPTAAVDGGGSADSFSVPTNGAVTAGRLIRTQGFLNAANNNVFVVAAASDSDSINVPTASLVAETAPSNALLMLVGVQGASGDIVLTSGGHLTSTTLDFTTLGLVRGMDIIIGDEATGTRFAEYSQTAPLWARIAATPTANLIQLESHSFAIASGGAGTSKTIRLFFGPYYQNRPINDTDYLEPTFHGELEDTDAATSNTVQVFSYVEGCALGKFEINAPLKNKMVATMSYCGTDAPNPVLVAERVSGPSSALAPLCSAMFDTSNDLEDVRLVDGTNGLVAEVNSWKLTIDHGVSPREVQGTLGALDHEFGKFRFSVTMEAYFNDYDQIKAARDNRDLEWRARAGNHQGGFSIYLPLVVLRSPKKKYERNKAIKLDCSVPAFRDQDTNVVAGMTLFGYVPFGGD